jgi:hypothetical protein
MLINWATVGWWERAPGTRIVAFFEQSKLVFKAQGSNPSKKQAD